MKRDVAATGKLSQKQMGLWGEIVQPAGKQSGEVNHLIRKTIRSGQKIEKKGNMIILGDVNPGAQIIATGDIIVFGSIKGVIHAGASGNQDAMIMAWDLRPTQLRIAGLISRAPDNWEDKRGPEVARISAERIIVESIS